MASIRKEVLIDAAPETVWDAARDIGALHTRLVPGFVANTRLVAGAEPPARMVTFANGVSVKEVIVDLDEARRRLVWKVESPTVTHHNGVLELSDAGHGQTRAVWVADVLPHAAAETFDLMMGQGLAAMKHAFESAPAP
jgi:uncharacterized protein YndB with AHSA1/START domain